MPRPPRPTLFPYTTLFRSDLAPQIGETTTQTHRLLRRGIPYGAPYFEPKDPDRGRDEGDRGLVFAAYQTSIEGQFEFVQAADRKSTRLNSSHSQISYAVFC